MKSFYDLKTSRKTKKRRNTYRGFALLLAILLALAVLTGCTGSPEVDDALNDVLDAALNEALDQVQEQVDQQLGGQSGPGVEFEGEISESDGSEEPDDTADDQWYAAFEGEDTDWDDWDVSEHTQFRKKQYLEEHYQKHVIRQAEFEEYGDITKEDYLKMAQMLVDAPDDDVLIKEEGDGDLLFYDEETNGFAVLSDDGYLRTYFRPTDGIEYFERQ